MENNGFSARPSQLIDPQKKDKKWHLQMIKSIYNDFNNNYPNAFYNGRQRYREIINYFKGNISSVRYQEILDYNRSHNYNLTQKNNDNRFLNVISKYIRRIYGGLENYKLECSLNPVDPLAQKHLNEYRIKLQALKDLNEIMQDKSIVSQIAQESGMAIPEDEDEIEIQLNTSAPMQYASDMEMALEWCNYLDGFDRKFSEAMLELIVLNIPAIKTKLNANGMPESDKVSGMDLLVGYHETEDGRDINEIGQFRFITINDLVKENHEENQLTEEDCKQIEKVYQGKFNNMSLAGLWKGNIGWYQSDLFYKYRIQVVELYWYSIDGETYAEYTDKNGNSRMVKKPYGYYVNSPEKFSSNYKNGKLHKTTNKNIYRGTWVVGTDYIYNWGLYRACNVSEYLPYELELPILISQPLIMDGNSTSIAEEMLAIADKANQCWKKMEEALNMARPKGFRLNIDGFIKAAEAMKGNLGMNVKEMMQQAIKNNIIYESGIPSAGTAYKSFEEIEGGLGNLWNDAKNGLMDCFVILEQMTGFGAATTGNPSAYATKGTSEIAVQSAELSIRHLYQSKKTLYERVMRQRAIYLEYSIREGKCKGLTYNLERNPKFVELSKISGLYMSALIVEDAPTAQEIQEFKQFIFEATKIPLEQGGIGLDDALTITDCRNLKQAKQLLTVMIRRNKRKAQQNAMQQFQAKGEQDQKSVMMAAQARQQELQMGAEIQIKVNREIEEEKRKTLQVQFLFEAQMKKLEGLIKADLETTQQISDQIMMDKKVMADISRVSAKGSELGTRKKY